MKELSLSILTLLCLPVLGQQVVTVKVVDNETKKPIKDADVQIKGTNITTRTNIGGYFQLTADTTNVLVISNYQYETTTLKVPVGLDKFQVGLKKSMPIDSTVFTVVEHMPEFPGGMAALFKFINKNLYYPQDARRLGLEGKVWVQFTVNKDGSLTDINVIKSLSPSCDQEAIRLIKTSPNWSPGTQNQIPVRCKFVLPINFGY